MLKTISGAAAPCVPAIRPVTHQSPPSSWTLEDALSLMETATFQDWNTRPDPDDAPRVRLMASIGEPTPEGYAIIEIDGYLVFATADGEITGLDSVKVRSVTLTPADDEKMTVYIRWGSNGVGPLRSAWGAAAWDLINRAGMQTRIVEAVAGVVL